MIRTIYMIIPCTHGIHFACNCQKWEGNMVNIIPFIHLEVLQNLVCADCFIFLIRRDINLCLKLSLQLTVIGSYIMSVSLLV